MSMSAKEHYEAGQLAEAIAAVTAEVKAKPTDVDRRGFLAELLCFTGNLERADLMLDTMGKQDPAVTVALSLFRHLVRADQARQQFYTEGRLPEFLDQPSDVLRLHLEASILLREGNAADAVAKLAEAEGMRAPVAGTCDGKPFDDFRDLDDLTAPFFEVLTSTGKYYWIPMDRVELVEFRKPQRPRDLLWRQANMVVNGGPDGEVYLPAIYAGTPAEDERALLGRSSDWVGGEGTPVRGQGQRCFLVGEEALPIVQIETLTFTRSA